MRRIRRMSHLPRRKRHDLQPKLQQQQQQQPQNEDNRFNHVIKPADFYLDILKKITRALVNNKYTTNLERFNMRPNFFDCSRAITSRDVRQSWQLSE